MGGSSAAADGLPMGVRRRVAWFRRQSDTGYVSRVKKFSALAFSQGLSVADMPITFLKRLVYHSPTVELTPFRATVRGSSIR